MDQICRIDDIEEGQSRGLSWGEHQLIAIKFEGQLYLYLNRCPHRGITLEWQPDQFLDRERQFIQCSSHGALFRIETGDCVQGPCQGQALTPIKYHLRDGVVWAEPIPPEALGV